jgi:predicted metal-dependent RNase
MLVLDEYMRQGLLKEAPVYLEGMINEATAIHTAYPEYLARSVRDQILYQGVNPFQSNYFTTIEKPDAREAAIEGGPCVIVATSGMLEGGPSMEYFRRLSSDSRNTLIFVSYQIDGTLGRRVQKGLTEAPMMNSGGKMEVVKVGVGIEAIEGFSGHSDRAQILNYVRRVAPKPEVVIVGHGERAKCIGVARLLQRMYRLDSRAPENLETIRLR